VIARIAVGCSTAAASSGNCGKGVLSAGFAIAAQPLIVKFPSFGVWGTAPEAVEAGLIEGEAAKLAGGKLKMDLQHQLCSIWRRHHRGAQTATWVCLRRSFVTRRPLVLIFTL
jgi:hypothetical protein